MWLVVKTWIRVVVIGRLLLLLFFIRLLFVGFVWGNVWVVCKVQVAVDIGWNILLSPARETFEKQWSTTLLSKLESFTSIDPGLDCDQEKYSNEISSTKFIKLQTFKNCQILPMKPRHLFLCKLIYLHTNKGTIWLESTGKKMVLI